jgi:hypothetical protein
VADVVAFLRTAGLERPARTKVCLAIGLILFIESLKGLSLDLIGEMTFRYLAAWFALLLQYLLHLELPVDVVFNFSGGETGKDGQRFLLADALLLGVTHALPLLMEIE